MPPTSSTPSPVIRNRRPFKSSKPHPSHSAKQSSILSKPRRVARKKVSRRKSPQRSIHSSTATSSKPYTRRARLASVSGSISAASAASSQASKDSATISSSSASSIDSSSTLVSFISLMAATHEY